VYKGDFISFLPYLMGRSEALWGEDAAVFRPERHLATVEGEGGVKRRVFKPPNPFVFTAFQAGPRVCMGQQLAYMEMKVTHHQGPCGACLVKGERCRLVVNGVMHGSMTLAWRCLDEASAHSALSAVCALCSLLTVMSLSLSLCCSLCMAVRVGVPVP
jgi:hypothetical protein